MIIANLNLELHASLAVYHLISNVHLWNNNIVKYGLKLTLSMENYCWIIETGNENQGHDQPR